MNALGAYGHRWFAEFIDVYEMKDRSGNMLNGLSGPETGIA